MVTGVAKSAAGVFGGHHLGKTLGLGRILLMATAAKISHIGKLRNVSRRVGGMTGQRTVAGFAGDVGVFACGAGLGFVVVAHDAGVLAGIRDGVLAHEVERTGAVVPVLAKGLGNDGAADDEEKRQAGQQDQGGTNQMGPITEYTVHEQAPYIRDIRLSSARY